MKIKQCEKCGKDIECSPSAESKRRFCSFECRKSIYTPEMRKKMSEIKKKQFKDGLTVWNKGVEQWAGEARKNLKTPAVKHGKDHPNWKGGVAYFKVRNVRKRQNGGSHTFGEWETLKAQFNWTCPACKEGDKELVRDHIIPLAKGGSDNIENIQPLCRSCNAKKHTKVVVYEPVLVEFRPSHAFREN